jgi:hypothetical protein
MNEVRDDVVRAYQTRRVLVLYVNHDDSHLLFEKRIGPGIGFVRVVIVASRASLRLAEKNVFTKTLEKTSRAVTRRPACA